MKPKDNLNKSKENQRKSQEKLRTSTICGRIGGSATENNVCVCAWYDFRILCLLSANTYIYIYVCLVRFLGPSFLWFGVFECWQVLWVVGLSLLVVGSCLLAVGVGVLGWIVCQFPLVLSVLQFSCWFHVMLVFVGVVVLRVDVFLYGLLSSYLRAI